MTIVRLEQGPVRADFTGAQKKAPPAPFPAPGRNFAYAGSGKGALSAILRHLSRTGVLENKMSAIHIPAWIGTAVSQTIMEHAFPVTAPNRHAKAVMPYHQYGFPQDMDRILDYASGIGAAVIEDCAHAPFGEYKGRRLGGMGDFALFSFSKFCFTGMLGGVSFADDGFKDTFAEACKDTGVMLSWICGQFKNLDEWNLSRKRPLCPRGMYLFRKMAYAVYGDLCKPRPRSVALWERKWQEERAARQDIYALYRRRFARLGICDHLEEQDVVPYAVPLLVRKDDAAKLAETLSAAGFESGVRMFDTARFFIEPSFSPCVIVPVHAGLGLNGAEKIATIVERVL
jgi:hypothetical protein